ncbi:MAG TPA: 2-C-methyl-D-erythritol 4-phosphate cytidylyltransferase [Clostridia bacterium]|nr:2-C-methyl-D-erythritol 4-phosphate cytidylyltransferase [Clostridia bacterium]
MYRSLTVTAIITAAGKGTRMKSPLSKQFLDLNGRPVLAHTLLAFQHCGVVDGILVVVAPGYIDRCGEDIVERFGITKVKGILAGGGTRQQSVSIGLEAVQEGIVVIHDGARPLVGCGLIEKGIERLMDLGLDGTACAVPIKDTVKLVDGAERVERTLDRERLRAVQTPQCFRAASVKEAHRRAALEGVQATDDLMLLERCGYRVALYPGLYDNIKITTPEDLLLAKVLLEGRDKSC